MENIQTETTFSLSELFSLLWKNKIFILIVTLVFTICALLFSLYLIPDKFETDSMITVSRLIDQDKPTQYDQSSDFLRYGSELAKRYNVIAKSDTVIAKVQEYLKNQGVKEEISENTIRKSITIESVNDTDILQITVTYKDPEISRLIAIAITDSSKTTFIEQYPNSTVNILDQPNKVIIIKPNFILNTLIGLLLGAMISIGFIILKEFLNRTIKSEADVEKYLGLSVLGTIPIYDKSYRMKK